MSQGFRTDIQALRGLAVSLVLLYHAGFDFFGAGFLGVDVFFVISGFLITDMVRKEVEAGRFSFINFYFRRAKRLLPAAYVTFLASAAVAPFVLNAQELQDFTRQVFGAVSFSANMVLLMQAVFSPMPQVLYGIVMVLIHTIVMDKMLMMGASRTEVKIISSQSDAICAAILEQLDRGVTILHGEGGYTHESSAVLLSIVSNRELPRLEKLAHSIDPTCFLIVSHVTEVSGRGFSLDKDYL